MAAKKKEKVEKVMYEPSVHPNVGIVVTMHLFHLGEGVMMKKPGIWNGTHWSMYNKKTGEPFSIPPHMRLKGWTE